jgi:hypothetical protein
MAAKELRFGDGARVRMLLRDVDLLADPVKVTPGLMGRKKPQPAPPLLPAMPGGTGSSIGC